MKQLFALAAAVLVGFAAYADSYPTGRRVSLGNCGGTAVIDAAYNGDYAIKLDDTYGDQLTVSTVTGRVIKSYNIPGAWHARRSASYTLSKAMLSSLGWNGTLQVTLSGGCYANFSVITGYYPPPAPIPYPRYPQPVPYPRYPRSEPGRGGHEKSGLTGYGRTNKGACAYYIRGQFQYHVADYNCR